MDHISKAMKPKQEAHEQVKQKIEARFQPILLSALLNKEFPDTEWIVEGVLPTTSLVLLSAAPSNYKTWLGLDICLKVASQQMVFGKFATHPCGILYVDEDGTGYREMQKRLKLLQAIPDSSIFILASSGFKLGAISIEGTIAFCQEKQIKLIVFDTFIRIHDARNENDSVEIARVFELLQRFKAAGIAVLLLHHNRKQYGFNPNPSQEIRGSSDILAAVDSHFSISSQRHKGTIRIVNTKSRFSKELPPFELQIVESDNKIEFNFIDFNTPNIVNDEDDAKQMIMGMVGSGGPMNIQTIYTALQQNHNNIGYKKTKIILEELVKTGALQEKRGKKKELIYEKGGDALEIS